MSEKKSVRFNDELDVSLLTADVEAPPPKPIDTPPEHKPSVSYDPSGVSEAYNIYTGAASETKTQRKSEDAVLAAQKAQAAAAMKDVAANVANQTAGFAGASAGRRTRGRTAVTAIGVTTQSMDIENPGSSNQGQSQSCADRCTACTVM